MSWASRRRTAYGMGVLLFLAVVIGVPLVYHFATIKPTCTDGTQNQGETAPDRGGPCPLLDPHALSPATILWSRSFRVRDGSYSAVAYIQNTNENAGIRHIAYRFRLYDADNITVAERTGTTNIMPGSVTPIFVANIDTGNRIAAHTYFDFTDAPVWERLDDTAHVVLINDKQLTDISSVPRLTATAINVDVANRPELTFIATVFDSAGNAFAASQTSVAKLSGGEKQQITFTWPGPFNVSPGRIDIIPVSAPVPPKAKRI